MRSNRWFGIAVAVGASVMGGTLQAQGPARRTAAELVAEANAKITTLTPRQALAQLGDSSVAFVDLREQNEIDRTGMIPGAVHAPRGMLEFYIDSGSRMHLPVFSSGKRIVFYCAGGGRSALAAARAQEMGLPNVAHVGGGIQAWIAAGGPVAAQNN